PASRLPRGEAYGPEGTWSLPDPNAFGGPVRVRLADGQSWETLDLIGGYDGESRGLGLADMAAAIRTGGGHRASGQLAFHVLDAMQAILESADSRQWRRLTSSCERPQPLPTGVAA